MIEITVNFPDVGCPGSASNGQIFALEKLLRTKLDFELSFEQASMVLSARDYANGVAIVRRRNGKHTSDDQILFMISTITNDTELLQYVYKWGRIRFARGSHNGDPRLRPNEHFKAIHKAAFGC